jgi:hypothetical protein
MNNLKRLLNTETRNNFMNYFRTSTYLAHPELKTKISKQKWKNLMTMRDLRLWVIEYAPFSSRTQKYSDQLEQVTREVLYLEFLSFSKRFFIFMALTIGLLVFGPQHYHGAMDLNARPVYYIYNLVLLE